MSKQEPIYGKHTKSVFDNNLYWRTGNKEIDFAEDLLAIFADPQLKLPGSKELQIEDPVQLKDLDFFKLLPESPCFEKGKIIPQNGGFDFWGNPISNDSKSLNIGAWQGDEK